MIGAGRDEDGVPLAEVDLGALDVERPAAFEHNVEFLVELLGKKSVCGIDAVLGGEEKPAFADLLVDFRQSAATTPRDEITLRLEEVLREVRRAAAKIGLSINVEPGASQDRYRLVLTSQEPFPAPSAVTARCWPVTLRVEASRPIEGAATVHTDFGLVSFEAITSFLAFEVTATIEGRSASSQFVLNVELKGAPENRQERLLLSILSDRERVLRFLLLLLAGTGVEAAWAKPSLPSSTNDGTGQMPFSERGLFEVLVRTLEREPKRLDQIAILVRDLKKTTAGAALLPDGFDAIWEPIWTVRQRITT